MESEIQRLGRFAAELRYENLPGTSIRAAKRLLADTLGCALGAVGCEPVGIAMRALEETAYASGDVTVIGYARRCSLEGAILLNGMLTRYLDFMDVYWSGDVCHPSENIPLALACTEATGGGGRRLIEALLVGYEAQIRLCDAFSFQAAGFHHASAAGYVAPLVIGKSMGLGPEQLAHAAALSGSRHQTLGVISKGEISMIKALGYPLSAMEAVLAARLAAKGFTGPTQALEWLFDRIRGSGGAERNDPAVLDLTLDRFAVEDVSLKRYPVQYALQAPVEAAVQLHKAAGHRLRGLSGVLVETHGHVVQRTADPAKYRPANRETADHSLPCCFAMALVDGDLLPRQFEERRWEAPEVRNVVDKTVVTVSEELDRKFPDGRGAVVTLQFGTGETLRAAVEIPSGDAANPLSDEAVESKFLAMAAPVIGADRARAALDLIWTVEQLPRISALTELFRVNQ